MTAERLLTPDEVANRLRLSRSWVYERLRTGELPALRVGGAWRIRAHALDEFLARCPTNTPRRALSMPHGSSFAAQLGAGIVVPLRPSARDTQDGRRVRVVYPRTKPRTGRAG